MKVELISSEYDPRVYFATIDFTGCSYESKWYPEYGITLRRRDTKVPFHFLDSLILKPLRLNRISHWDTVWPRHYRKRTVIYRTTVISDRWNKRNDVG